MANTLGAKEQEVMSYLHERVFDPILTSPSASDRLKQGIRFTIMRMRKRDAAGMVSYYWAAVKGTDPSITFAALMRAEGFNRFEEVLEDFRERFNDRFLLQRR
ncbi:hypothetical protein ELH48_09250 [Rhizobium ruizarguesonis]|uniref:hypothetical protein n=1 Tax=Rhizobium ruizarguesonis TaxID=2081791 RepID=UPI001030D401|nr:hypothetical protein [Rhizobium ruizarguesonis]TBB27323.1 hypothetical protein ELH48_09250 [Rhizobium ruizarguesonis]